MFLILARPAIKLIAGIMKHLSSLFYYLSNEYMQSYQHFFSMREHLYNRHQLWCRVFQKNCVFSYMPLWSPLKDQLPTKSNPISLLLSEYQLKQYNGWRRGKVRTISRKNTIFMEHPVNYLNRKDKAYEAASEFSN